jgi:phage terminase large subunit GpA-like protein
MDLLEIRRAIRSGLRPLEAVAPLRLSQWAEQHFYLSAESSYVEQRWIAYPYQRAIMDCISNDDVEEVVFRKSARVGYTKMALAAIAYFVEHKRRNQAVWQPTDEDSDEFVKTELEPMLRDVPAMQLVFPSFMHKHKHNTLRQKIFLGAMLHMRGGKAAKNYRRLSVSVAYLDEIDGFDLDVEGEGDPVALARKRIEGATYPKLVLGSTPKIKGFSLVEAREAQAELRFRYLVPCPHCATPQPLRWGGADKPFGFKWTAGDAESVAHLCETCQAMFSQADYLAVWDQGRHVAQDGTWIDQDGRFRTADGALRTPPRSVAFHVWTAYSPQVSWPELVREFLAANAKAASGDKAGLKAFVNTTLGEAWEEEVERADQHELKRRAEGYALRVVPRGGLVLVAGVDVQDDRFEIVVWALGRGEEMWPIDYAVLSANPADDRDWEKLDAYLLTRFPCATGGRLGIEAVAVDTGGHFTHQAYNFARLRPSRRIFAVKGETRQGMPVKGRSSFQDVNWRGKVIKSGVKLWHVGTDTAKDLLHGRLKVSVPGPGYVHFAKALPDEFFDQITAEARMLQKTSQGERYRWVATRSRNEVLDCTVYAIFAAHMLDLHRYTDRMWQKLESAVAPPTADMFDRANVPEGGESVEPAPEAARAPRRTAVAAPAAPAGGFASREWMDRL